MIKEAIDAAYSAAWSALQDTLTSKGISFDDADDALYVDDDKHNKTYKMAVTLVECDQFGNPLTGN